MIALRKNEAVRKRFISSSIAVGITTLFLFLTIAFNPLNIGRLLFYGLMAWSLFQLTHSASELSLGLFSEERRNKTLGLLFLTGLGPGEIFVGKTAGVLMISLYRFLAILPCFALPFLMGGISGAIFLATVETLLCWFAFSVCVSLLASVLFEEESASKTFSEVFSLAIIAAVPVISAINKFLVGTHLDSFWLCFSPGYSIWILYEMDSTRLNYLHFTNLLTLSCSFCFCLFACMFLGRTWQEQTCGVSRESSAFSRLFKSYRERRARSAATLLDQNPFAWLIARDPRPFLLSWACILAVLLVWICGLWKWSKFWLLPINLWAASFALTIVTRWMAHYLAAKQIGENRHSGGLELLLTSDLAVSDIVAGQDLAFRRYSKSLFPAVGVIFLLFYVAGFFGRSWNPAAIASYTMIWFLVAAWGPWMEPGKYWNSFWIGLNTGRPGFALRKHLWQKGAFIWVYYHIYMQRQHLAKIPFGSFVELIIVGSLFGIFLLIGFFAKPPSIVIRGKILAEMREIAQEPVPEASDPRLKKWNPAESLFRRPSEKILV